MIFVRLDSNFCAFDIYRGFAMLQFLTLVIHMFAASYIKRLIHLLIEVKDAVVIPLFFAMLSRVTFHPLLCQPDEVSPTCHTQRQPNLMLGLISG